MSKLITLSAATERFYNSTRWKKVRTLKMDKDPLCEPCTEDGRIAPATDVHHVQPIRAPAGWSLRFTLGNLQSVCKSHHAKGVGA